MVKLKRTIKAFTIIESMVALVIIVITLSLSAMVIAKVTHTGMSREKQNAYMLVNALRNETLIQERFLDEQMEVNGYSLEKTILDYPKSETLKVLLIEAVKNKKKLYQSKEIIILNN